MRSVIGIDGGCPGGAVQIDGRKRLLWAAFWDLDGAHIVLRVVFRTHWTDPPQWGVTVWRLEAVDARVGAGLRHLALRWGPSVDGRPDALVAIEGTFVGKDKERALALTWQASAQVAHLEDATRQPAARYLATTWRADVLSLANRTSSTAAKAASMAHIPLQIAGLADALAVLNLGKTAHHVTDAGGIALCRWNAAQAAEPAREAS